MNIKKKRWAIEFLNVLDQPIKFNPFVFSRMFFLWMLLGVIGGIIAGAYMISLELVIHNLSYFTGIWVIPVMAIAGLLAGITVFQAMFQ